MDDNVIDLSRFKPESVSDPALTPEELRDAQLLEMVRGLGKQVAELRAEQVALDENMAHVAQALQAIVEAAAVKLKIHE